MALMSSPALLCCFITLEQLLGEKAEYGLKELGLVDGLVEVGVCALLLGPEGICLGVFAALEDHRDLCQPWGGFYLPAGLEAIFSGHNYIHYNEVGVFFRCNLYAFFPICGSNDGVSPPPKEQTGEFSLNWAIINDQYCGHDFYN